MSGYAASADSVTTAACPIAIDHVPRPAQRPHRRSAQSSYLAIPTQRNRKCTHASSLSPHPTPSTTAPSHCKLSATRTHDNLCAARTHVPCGSCLRSTAHISPTTTEGHGNNLHRSRGATKLKACSQYRMEGGSRVAAPPSPHKPPRFTSPSGSQASSRASPRAHHLPGRMELRRSPTTLEAIDEMDERRPLAGRLLMPEID